MQSDFINTFCEIKGTRRESRPARQIFSARSTLCRLRHSVRHTTTQCQTNFLRIGHTLSCVRHTLSCVRHSQTRCKSHSSRIGHTLYCVRHTLQYARHSHGRDESRPARQIFSARSTPCELDTPSHVPDTPSHVSDTVRRGVSHTPYGLDTPSSVSDTISNVPVAAPGGMSRAPRGRSPLPAALPAMSDSVRHTTAQCQTHFLRIGHTFYCIRHTLSCV